LDAIWRRVTDTSRRRPRLVVVDEGWLLMRQPEGARFLYRMAKAARKHWAGLSVITQDAADVLGSDLGQAVVANAATQILLRQAPQALDQIAEAFGLTDGERQLLASARRGQGLLAAGADRVAFDVVASPAENALATTSPEFLAELERNSTDEFTELDASSGGFGLLHTEPDEEAEL
jgi:type IV secretory pathway VirB4 component